MLLALVTDDFGVFSLVRGFRLYCVFQRFDPFDYRAWSFTIELLHYGSLPSPLDKGAPLTQSKADCRLPDVVMRGKWSLLKWS